MLQQLKPAFLSLLVFTVLTGRLPLAVTGIAQLLFPAQASSSCSSGTTPSSARR
jgi:K+-transporting ATPase c subunit